MPRDAYFAPGVYVEEIPSARQPIAGVGTNTVGFIGAVPDVIWCPVRNPNYDPVMARTLANYRRARAASSDAERARADASAAALSARQAILQSQIADLTPQVDKLRNDVQTAHQHVATAQNALNALGPDATPQQIQAARDELATAHNEVAEKSSELDPKEQELNRAQRNLDAINQPLRPSGPPPAPAPVAPAPQFGETDDDYEASDPPEELQNPSMFSPYHLAKFQVTVAEFDTKLCTNFSEYTALFGGFSAFKDNNPQETDPAKKTFQPYSRGHHELTQAVYGFFANGGTKCFVARVKPGNIANWTRALTMFESIEEVAILAAPGLPKDRDNWEELQTYCESDAHMNVFAILDSPSLVEDEHANLDTTKLQPDNPNAVMPRRSAHAAFYFPHIEVVDPAKRLQDSDPAWGVEPKYHGRCYVPPSGHVAGIYARTDEERGVHKAPANATVRGALEVKYYVSSPKQEGLNPQGVNCIRLMNGDVRVWGARNIGGDSLGEWKYVSVRRFAGFLEESIRRGTQWVVFEPNDPSLWSKIILNISAFLTNVWRNGALFGLTPQEAFYVKCDEELNPPEVRDLGMVITEIGVAIVRPAEFVIFRIQQTTGSEQG
jgi:phage tail sheath protein FI